MHCLFCKHEDTDVIETRVAEGGAVIRRRRACGKCDKRFTTYERVESNPILIIKRDKRRERFDSQKLKNGIMRATGKTTVSAANIDEIVNFVESELRQDSTTEVDSRVIGRLVAKRLKKLDKVAYIRFASVFRRFVDVEEFQKEVERLL